MALDSGSHRGFGFVDFVAASDAKVESIFLYVFFFIINFQNAFEALSQSTHLYGRRLVLEWAASDDSVEDIRKRTAAHFKTTEAVKSKKSVLSID